MHQKKKHVLTRPCITESPIREEPGHIHIRYGDMVSGSIGDFVFQFAVHKQVLSNAAGYGRSASSAHNHTGYRSHPLPNIWRCTVLLPARTTEQVRCLLEPTLPPGTHTAAGWQQKLKPLCEPTFGEACTAALEAGGSAADCWTCDWGLIFVWIRAYFLWNLNLGLISWISMK